MDVPKKSGQRRKNWQFQGTAVVGHRSSYLADVDAWNKYLLEIREPGREDCTRGMMQSFHGQHAPRMVITDEDYEKGECFVDLTLYEFDRKRAEALSCLYDTVSKRWDNGLLSAFYTLDFFSDTDSSSITPATHLNVIERASRDGLLPEQIRGCSTEYLKAGNLWPESLEEFAATLRRAVQQGGPYSARLPEVDAALLVERYIDALIGHSARRALNIFGMDTGFSCWFFGTYWDFAYTLAHFGEGWVGIVCATAMD